MREKLLFRINSIIISFDPFRHYHLRYRLKQACAWQLFTLLKNYNLRSSSFNPDRHNIGGRNYALFAFITDVEDSIDVGNDGIEHL